MRAQVVEVGQRPGSQRDGGLRIFRQDAVWIANRLFARRGGGRDFRHDLDQIGRVEPCTALLVQRPRGLGNADGAGVFRIVRRRDVRRQPLRKGEGLEYALTIVGWIISHAMP